ncbi:MAG: hypothetical protein ACLF0G_14980 [Candidatus Brocadiia bacterium]
MVSRHVRVTVLAGLALAAAGGSAEAADGGEGKLAADGLVIAADDLALEVGERRTYALATPAGEPIGEVGVAVVDRRRVGGTTLYRQAVRFGAMRIADQWVAVGDVGLAFYDSFGAALPDNHYPLPLEEGKAFGYESTRGKVRARVVGTEAVEVPAGKFPCLALVREREAGGEQETEREWVARGVGTVKVTGEDFVMTLASAEAPAKPEPEEGAVVLNTFDTPDPLRSERFPRGVWSGVVGEPGRSSVVDVDPFVGGANGTPFCLRWSYTTVGTWAAASMTPGGNPWTAADLSKYKGVCFYIKGLLERPCTLTLHAKAAGEDRRTMVHIPVQVTTQWRRVVLTPETHPQMNGIDARQVYIVSLGDASEEGAANVIWVDQVKLLLGGDEADF